MTDVLIGFFLATLITAIFTTRLFKLYQWYAFNSLFLGLIAIFIANQINDKQMLMIGVITILIKFLFIPYVLKKLSIKFNIPRQIVPNIKIQHSVMVVPIVLVFTFYLVTPILGPFGTNYVAIAISSLFLALLLIMEHKDIASKIIGFLFIENSLFLLGISATNGMPMLLELGIFFDLLMFIVIINLLFKGEKEWS